MMVLFMHRCHMLTTLQCAHTMARLEAPSYGCSLSTPSGLRWYCAFFAGPLSCA